MELEININKKLTVDIDPNELVQSINLLPIIHRWNFIARMIAQAELNTNDLSDEQKQILKPFLTSILSTL